MTNLKSPGHQILPPLTNIWYDDPMSTQKPISMKVVDDRLFDYGLPSTATLGSAGYDLRAIIDEPILLPPDQSCKVPTGVAISIGHRDLAAFLFPRSGLAASYNLTLQNAVGVIDSDYQGEIKVLIRNEGDDTYKINPGDRIAQMVFIPVAHPVNRIVTEFEETTQRGAQGFGHTGGRHDHTPLTSRPDSPDQDDTPALKPGAVTPTELLGSDDIPPEDEDEDGLSGTTLADRLCAVLDTEGLNTKSPSNQPPYNQDLDIGDEDER